MEQSNPQRVSPAKTDDMPRQKVPITGSVLRWARLEAGLSEEELAGRINGSADDVRSWEEERDQPSKTEFSRLVTTLKRSKPVFFLPEPPEAAALPASLRSAPGLLGHRLAPDEIRELRRARRLQEATSWLLTLEEKPRVDLPTLPVARSPEDAASTARDWVGIEVSDQLRWEGDSAAFKSWRAQLETRGLLVFQLQLGSEGIRGFSLSDSAAPLIATNTAYNVAARIYTLFHELGHLVSQTDSACYGFVSPTSTRANVSVERWCEEFAAAFLVPPSHLDAVATRYRRTRPESTDFDVARNVARQFKVSIRAAAIRLMRVGLASQDLYAEVEANARVVDRPRPAGGGGGQTTAERRISQFGLKVPDVLVGAVADKTIDARSAIDYLEVNLNQLDDLSRLLSRT